MRLLGLVCLTMTAFAANSVLNRLALAGGEAGAASFAALRLVSGAVMLFVLVWLRGTSLPRSGGWVGPLALFAYMAGFSYAYLSLDAGVGALVLFGGVQVTMFIGALMRAENIPLARWAGATLAFSGLVFLMWPSGSVQVSPEGGALMLIAAVGWGVYSLLGAGARDPLGLTGRNFLLAAPLGLALLVIRPDSLSLQGALLAVLAGAVTSGLGYALWYRVLPQISASIAAVAQLTVPIIALAGGMVFLDETADWRFAVAALMVLGGVLLSLYRTRGSRGS